MIHYTFPKYREYWGGEWEYCMIDTADAAEYQSIDDFLKASILISGRHSASTEDDCCKDWDIYRSCLELLNIGGLRADTKVEIICNTHSDVDVGLLHDGRYYRIQWWAY